MELYWYVLKAGLMNAIIIILSVPCMQELIKQNSNFGFENMPSTENLTGQTELFANITKFEV
jgi:hypothetical protein